MGFFQDFQHHTAVNTCTDVAQISQPLLKMGISFFVFTRIYPDKRRIVLSNKHLWNESYLIKRHQNLYQDNEQIEETINYNFFIVPEMYPSVLAFQDAKGMLGLQSALVMPRHYANYKEVCYFASEKMDAFQYNYYMENANLFLRFIDFFKEKGARIIQCAEQEKLNPTTLYLPQQNENASNLAFTPDKDEFISQISTQHFYLPFDSKKRVISHREYQCAQLLAQGKTTKEIAILLKLSPRTAETYIENLKVKFTCAKSSQLIYKLAKLGLELTE